MRLESGFICENCTDIRLDIGEYIKSIWMNYVWSICWCRPCWTWQGCCGWCVISWWPWRCLRCVPCAGPGDLRASTVWPPSSPKNCSPSLTTRKLNAPSTPVLGFLNKYFIIIIICFISIQLYSIINLLLYFIAIIISCIIDKSDKFTDSDDVLYCIGLWTMFWMIPDVF